MCCSPIMEGMGSANGGPSQGGHWGAAMVTSAVRSLCLTSRSGMYGANWLKPAKGRVHCGVVRGFAAVGHMIRNLYVLGHMNFSLIIIVSWESPCRANEYQPCFKHESVHLRPYSYLHFGH